MKQISKPPLRCCLILMALGSLMTSGCSRSFWRSQADFDAYNLLSQKQFDPHWVLPRTTIDPDPRSRFYDPFDRDSPPLPPDDPAASRYMEWVGNCIRGYKSWHKFGQAMSVENPQWLANFGLAPDTFHDSYELSDGVTELTDPSKMPTENLGKLVPTIENLTLAQTIELSSIHSRDYQTQLENLYLSALQLSLDQYQFQVRYLAGRAPTTPTTTLPAGSVPTGILNNTTIPGVANTLGLSSAGGVSQILPTGGQWAVGLANNTLWLFSGGQRTTSQSLLSYSLVQPLLAGAGRKFFLENLTFSERTLLYNVRVLARYRRLFFADAVINTGGGTTSTTTAISSGSLSSVINLAVNPSAGAGIGQAAGYYGILRQLQQVINQHQNVELLRIQAERLRELLAQTPFRRLDLGALPNGIEFPPELAGKIEYLDATGHLRWTATDMMTEIERDQLLALNDNPQYRTAIGEIFAQLRIGVTTLAYLQVATQLTNAEIQERTLKLSYDDEIDQFKFFLGLPTDMQITIDRSMLKPFELTDPRLLAVESALVKFVSRAWRLSDIDPPLADLRFVVDQFGQMAEFVERVGIQQVTGELKRVEANLPRRLRRLLWDESKESVVRTLERDTIVFTNVRAGFENVNLQIQDWKSRLNQSDLTQDDRKAILVALKDAREELLQITQNIRVLQTGLRTELIELADFDMSLDEATETALANRVDLMNFRGRVMDSRRNVEVAANRLEAIVNLVAQGNLNTPPGQNHPLDFRGAASSFQVGLQMTAPLDQLQVRNAYRQSLINYNQARRAFMLLEDQIKYDIRTSWRQLKLNAQNFETTRKILRQAALQLDINVATNLDPKLQVAGQAGTTNLGNNTGINLLQATSAVLAAQNNLIQFWTSYERNRINIYRDMDIMEIDEKGLWIDPLYQNLDHQDSLLPANEPADAIPPQPATAGAGRSPASHTKRSPHPGIVRLGVFSEASDPESEVEERSDRDRSRDLRRARLALSSIRLVSDFDSADEYSGSDRGFGDGDSEDGPVPDHRGRKGYDRQYEEFGIDE